MTEEKYVWTNEAYQAVVAKKLALQATVDELEKRLRQWEIDAMEAQAIDEENHYLRLRLVQAEEETMNLYRHYKGELYEVLAPHARDVDTNQQLVVYRSLRTKKVWVRPWIDFYCFVELEDGTQVVRFEAVNLEKLLSLNAAHLEQGRA